MRLRQHLHDQRLRRHGTATWLAMRLSRRECRQPGLQIALVPLGSTVRRGGLPGAPVRAVLRFPAMRRRMLVRCLAGRRPGHVYQYWARCRFRRGRCYLVASGTAFAAMSDRT
jgi:hypothetical protein